MDKIYVNDSFDNTDDNKKRFRDDNDICYDDLPKFYKANKEREDRIVTKKKVFKLDLPIDQFVWFINNLKIRDQCEHDSEDRYKKDIELYEKYIFYNNTNLKDLKEIQTLCSSDNIITKIINSYHTNDVKAILYEKYQNYCKDQTTEEYMKIIQWINTILQLPKDCIEKKVNIDIILKKLYDEMDKNIYGMKEAKLKILEIMNAKLTNPSYRGKYLTLVGPQGVGKTLFANAIATAMGKSFSNISIGSISDPVILTGHSSTYIGSHPSIFTQILTKTQTKSGCILLDEIEAASTNPIVSSTLLHVLDETSNDKFTDMYTQPIPIDLSQINFFLSSISLEGLRKDLIDRMEQVIIPGYTIQDKVNILKNHVLPQLKQNLKLKDKEITIGTTELEYFVTKKTELCSGMRDAKKKIRSLFERILLIKNMPSISNHYNINKITFPLIITIDIIDKLSKN
jgi:ATP-dependent Lon protease